MLSGSTELLGANLLCLKVLRLYLVLADLAYTELDWMS